MVANWNGTAYDSWLYQKADDYNTSGNPDDCDRDCENCYCTGNCWYYDEEQREHIANNMVDYMKENG